MSSAYAETIICLANSRKNTGRCVAGKIVKSGNWVRPVSARPTAELSRQDRRYRDGNDVSLLDLVSISFKKPQPAFYQSENHLIDADYYWEKTGVAGWSDVLANLDVVTGPLWTNANSSYSGINDRVDDTTAANLTSSLVLILVKDLMITVAIGGPSGHSKRQVRGSFSLNGHDYKLMITDPIVEDQYLGGSDGTFAIGEAALCVSLGEIFNEFAYKLIAGVILPP